MAAGKAGVPFDPNGVTAHLAGTMVFQNGQPTAFDAAALSQKMKVKELDIHLDLGVGEGNRHRLHLRLLLRLRQNQRGVPYIGGQFHAKRTAWDEMAFR